MKTEIKRYGLIFSILFLFLGAVLTTSALAVQNESSGENGLGAEHKDSNKSVGIKNHLKAIDKKIEIAEKLTARLENCSNISNLTSLIADIKISRDKLKTAIENSNRTEFKSAKKDLRSEWVSLKQQMRYNIVDCRSQRLKNAIEKAENITDRLENMITKLESKGGNTSSLEGMIQDAENLRKEAKDALDEGNIKEAKAKFGELKDKIKEISKKIRNIIKDLKTKK